SCDRDPVAATKRSIAVAHNNSIARARDRASGQHVDGIVSCACDDPILGAMTFPATPIVLLPKMVIPKLNALVTVLAAPMLMSLFATGDLDGFRSQREDVAVEDDGIGAVAFYANREAGTVIKDPRIGKHIERIAPVERDAWRVEDRAGYNLGGKDCDGGHDL